jgi:hypothetical protein
MHTLTAQALQKLTETLTVKFVAESDVENSDGVPLMSLAWHSLKRNRSGRHHFTMDIEAPESLTGISDSDEPVPQIWELKEAIKHENGAFLLRFCAWGGGLTSPHHEGKEMFIDGRVFRPVVAGMLKEPTIPNEQITSAIGLNCYFKAK